MQQGKRKKARLTMLRMFIHKYNEESDIVSLYNEQRTFKEH